MKNFKNLFLAAVVVLSTAAMAKAEGESAKNPMKTAESLKMGMAHHIQNLNLGTFALSDESVVVEFVVNKEGNVAIVSVDCDNCVVKSYVEQMLKDKTIFVTDELCNQVHSLSVRYVQI